MFFKFMACICLAFFVDCASAIDLSGLQNAHDPGTITKDEDTYFNFTTGTGIWYSTSKDLTSWTGGPGPVFSTYPAWIKNKIPNFGGSFWAPDVIHMNGYYYIYYSVSSFGSSVSAIGVARSASLKNPGWTDLGIVVESYGGSAEINAIDPAVFRDHNGKIYLSYGSFFGGIGVAEINQSTGKLASGVTHILGGGGSDMEAPYITRNGDYYYLFVNRGKCCQGVNSTYYIEVSRSTSVTGPYTDTRIALPNVDGKYKGPGHIGVLKDNGCNYVSTHYYDLNDGGNAKLDLLKMTYSGGWPNLTRNFSVASCGGVSDGLYRFTARHSGKDLTIDTNATTINGNPVYLAEQYTYSGTKNQQWYVINQGTGYYSMINANSLQSLDVYGNAATAGASIAQWPYWGGNGQKWNFTGSAGFYLIESNLSGLPLDVLNLSTANGARVIQWNPTGAANQQWSMVRLK
ncbi:family 43 glycosylhydrolase [Undibacterium sp. Jales W-56]|uniref:family 43 glycosylhydrolase n=1 Tax=Undibacterium sp. Jales W-56 TaxID=2897325 RepID=UPI0021D35270|nr:family 43 glycosylhydrolase [Undibacterium sp. Jales W-56]MCU6435687.1 family 43 glycosylhydrolase [Undibacterium sp. Jales W-56]